MLHAHQLQLVTAQSEQQFWKSADHLRGTKFSLFFTLYFPQTTKSPAHRRIPVLPFTCFIVCKNYSRHICC